jgi:hypothetical protein
VIPLAALLALLAAYPPAGLLAAVFALGVAVEFMTWRRHRRRRQARRSVLVQEWAAMLLAAQRVGGSR